MFGMYKIKRSSKDSVRCLFNVSKIGIIWYLVGQYLSSLIINFEQVIKSFLFWDIYCTFFLPVVDCTFLPEYWRATSWKYSFQNIAQMSSPCYVAGIWTPTLMKMLSAKDAYVKIYSRDSC